MARQPRITVNGHDTTWTTSTRPTNPDHGLIGYNETTRKLETWDAIEEAWMVTDELTAVYPA